MFHIKNCVFAKAAALVAVAFLALKVSADTATMTIGRASGRSVTYEQVGKTDTAGCAVFYPAATMQAYKGCRITRVQLQTYTRTGKDSLRIVIARAPGKKPLYTQTVHEEVEGWADIALDTPYGIDGDDLFIGYTVVGTRMLCYSNALVSGQEYVWKKAGGWALYTGDYAATLMATVEGDHLPQDVRLTTAVMPSHAVAGTYVKFSGQVVNLGASAVNSLTVTYYKDDVPAGQETVEGLSIASRQKGYFALKGLHLDQEGEPLVSFAITAVNGVPDGVPADNASRTVNMIVRKTFTKRKTLFEVFSTELCPNCPEAHATIDRLLGGKSDIIEVGHHSAFYTDPYTVQESVDYEWFFKQYKLYAPAMMFNRTSLADDYPNVFSDGVAPMPVSQAAIETVYPIAEADPAYATVDITRTYNAATRLLSVHVEGRQLLPWATPDSLRLSVMLTEDSLYTEDQRGAAAGFYHRHSLRRMLTPQWGDKINLANGYSATYTTTLPAEWREGQMRIVAFVSNYDSLDKTNCRVLNAAEAPVLDGGTNAISPTLAAGRLTFDGLKISASGHITVCTPAGAIVAQGRNTLSTATLPSGLYIVKAGGQSMKIKK